MRQTIVVAAITFGLGFAVAAIVRPSHRAHRVDEYPVKIEWLAPGTDAHPLPVRRTVTPTQALEGDVSTELKSAPDGLPTHSIIVTFPGGRKYTLAGVDATAR
jgi:hypothetical protein